MVFGICCNPHAEAWSYLLGGAMVIVMADAVLETIRSDGCSASISLTRYLDASLAEFGERP